MGKVPKLWETSGTITITDSLSNNCFTLPTFGTLSIVFSALNIVKAMIELNISQVHVDKIENSKAFFKKFVGCCLCHFPFLAAGAYFRITSCTISYTYLGNFALVPIGIFWIANLFIGYRYFDQKQNPLWLICFVSIFFPVFLSMKLINER